MPKVLLPLAPGFDDVEAITFIEILQKVKFDVTIATLFDKDTPVCGAFNSRLIPDKLIEETQNEEYDAIIFTGGKGSLKLLESSTLKKITLEHFQKNKLVGAICISPTILGEYGILNNKHITVSPSHIDKMPKDAKISNELVVIDGNIITGKGPGAAMEFVFRVVEILGGDDFKDLYQNAKDNKML